HVEGLQQGTTLPVPVILQAQDDLLEARRGSGGGGHGRAAECGAGIVGPGRCAAGRGRARRDVRQRAILAGLRPATAAAARSSSATASTGQLPVRAYGVRPLRPCTLTASAPRR